MGRRKKKIQRDEDSNANADQIPEKHRELVQNLNEIFKNRSEREIYLTLVECNMRAEFATSRLLAEGKDIVSKIVQNLKKLVNCSEEKIEEVLLECNMDPNETVNRLLSQDHILEEKREIIQKLMNIVNGLRQEIYAVLLECNMDADEAVNSLLSQVSDKETSTVQEIHNHLADSSTTSDNLGCEPPLNSDVSDVNTNKVPISLDDAVSSLSVSSSLGRGTNGKRIMGLDSSKVNVTKAPEKPDVPKAVPSLSAVSSSLGRGANGKRIMGLDSSKVNVTKAPEKPDVPTAVPSLPDSRPSCYAAAVKKGLAPSEKNETKTQPTLVAQADPQNSTSPLNQTMRSVSSLTEINEQAISHHYSLPEAPFDVSGDDITSEIAKNLASLVLPDDNSNLWDPQGHNNSYRLFKRQDQKQQSPSIRPIQPPQQQQRHQIHQSPNFISTLPQQQHQIHQSPSYMHSQPQQQQPWNHHSPSFTPMQPQQQQPWNHLFRYSHPQQLQHQNHPFRYSQPQQQHQIHQSQIFGHIQPQQQQQYQNHQSPSSRYIQPQQHWFHQSPSSRHIQQQQQQQQNNRRDPSKQTQTEQWPRNNYE